MGGLRVWVVLTQLNFLCAIVKLKLPHAVQMREYNLIYFQIYSSDAYNVFMHCDTVFVLTNILGASTGQL